jgi:hypothetical protein
LQQAKKIKAQNLLLTEEMASLELELDDLEYLDLSDPDFADILAELSETSDPSQQRTY